MESRINNPQRMKQLIDFQGLAVDGYIYPTDIDGLIEYKDSEYILFEPMLIQMMATIMPSKHL